MSFLLSGNKGFQVGSLSSLSTRTCHSFSLTFSSLKDLTSKLSLSTRLEFSDKEIKHKEEAIKEEEGLTGAPSLEEDIVKVRLITLRTEEEEGEANGEVEEVIVTSITEESFKQSLSKKDKSLAEATKHTARGSNGTG